MRLSISHALFYYHVSKFKRLLKMSSFSVQWLVHTAREWDRGGYRELDPLNGKQLILVPFPVSDQCEDFCTVY